LGAGQGKAEVKRFISDTFFNLFVAFFNLFVPFLNLFAVFLNLLETFFNLFAAFLVFSPHLLIFLAYFLIFQSYFLMFLSATFKDFGWFLPEFSLTFRYSASISALRSAEPLECRLFEALPMVRMSYLCQFPCTLAKVFSIQIGCSVFGNDVMDMGPRGYHAGTLF